MTWKDSTDKTLLTSAPSGAVFMYHTADYRFYQKQSNIEKIVVPSLQKSYIHFVTMKEKSTMNSILKHFYLFLTILLVSAVAVSCGDNGKTLIIDHNSANISAIPDKWITEAKALRIHYAHTSHGSQVITGLNYLEEHVDGVRYSVATRTSSSTAGLPAVEDPAALLIYDGNPPETYIEPNDYWDGEAALNRTRAVASTGDYDISLWSWCGQQSSNSAATVESYLAAMSTLEAEYPNMTFIYMTGHTDGGSAILERNNNLVRQYCLDNNKVLYDFADIESHDPDGTAYPDTSDGCAWCTDWCSEHTSDCQNLPTCSHSHGFNCVLKGRAFWYLLARIAGWDG